MLTLQKLKDMNPHTIFANGVTKNSPDGIFMTRNGGELKWLAIRGGIHDWAIYCHWSNRSLEWIRDHGDKIHNKEIIKKLIPCDDEAFSMYRY